VPGPPATAASGVPPTVPDGPPPGRCGRADPEDPAYFGPHGRVEDEHPGAEEGRVAGIVEKGPTADGHQPVVDVAEGARLRALPPDVLQVAVGENQARATLKGFEVMRTFKKGQFSPWIEAVGSGTEVRFINRLFDLQA
jgi:hypothetical protein